MIPSNPIPQVPNYGSSAQYRDLPSEEQIRAGVIPLDSLPAAWWNAMWFCTNGAVNEARSAVGTLITEVCNAITGAGICINESCVDQLYQAIETIRQRVGNAITAGAVKSSSACGEVSIDANGIMTANGVGNAALLNTTSKVIVNAINELKTTYDCCLSGLSGCICSVNNSKAPTSHVSSATTYGVGNADCYGHLKISDTYDSCVGSAADGVAASQQALYCVYNAIQAAASLGNSAGCPLGTAAAGTATTAARSDHVHPNACSLVDCTNISCKIIEVYGGNELNFVSTGAWINYSGGNCELKIGDGNKGCGTVIAKRFCGNVCGTASCAVLASHAIQADCASCAYWVSNAICVFVSGTTACAKNMTGNDMIAIPDADATRCSLYVSLLANRHFPIAGLYVPAGAQVCLETHTCFSGKSAFYTRGLRVF